MAWAAPHVHGPQVHIKYCHEQVPVCSFKGPFTLRNIFLERENVFCLEPISCAWELTRQRKIVHKRFVRP